MRTVIYNKHLLKYSDQYGQYVFLDINGVTQRLRHIPAGTFMMGSDVDERESHSAEHPKHQVTLSADFWLADTAVTERLYQAVMGKRKPCFEGLDLPAVNISFENLVEFLERVHQLTGYFADIPCEAQWEYAARAGTTSAFWWGDTINPRRANYSQETYRGFSHYEEDKTPVNCPHRPVPVDFYQPNPWGLHICGNVWEWNKGYRIYTNEPIIDPSWNEGKRGLKGGSYDSCAGSLRPSDRAHHPGNLQNALGFRFLLPTLEPKPFVHKPKSDEGLKSTLRIPKRRYPPDPEHVTEDDYTELRQTLLRYLRTNLSLDIEDKIRVFDDLNYLNYWQLTDIISVFKEEMQNFANLQHKHPQDIKALNELRADEWKIVVKSFTKITKN